VLERADKMGDLFEPVLTRKQKLPSIDKLERAVAKVMGAAQVAQVQVSGPREVEVAPPEPAAKKTAKARAKVVEKPATRRVRRRG
jgi:hypothetical protein